MNENNATVTESAPAAPAATPKAKVKAKVKKSPAKGKAPANKKSNKAGDGVKRTSNYRADGGLVSRQVAILKALKKRDRPVSVDQLADDLGLEGGNRKTAGWAVGAVRPTSGAVDPLSLLGRKLVKKKTIDVEGRKEHLIEITASGRQALARATAA